MIGKKKKTANYGDFMVQPIQNPEYTIPEQVNNPAASCGAC
jgi:hypothetical protein